MHLASLLEIVGSPGTNKYCFDEDSIGTSCPLLEVFPFESSFKNAAVFLLGGTDFWFLHFTRGYLSHPLQPIHWRHYTYLSLQCIRGKSHTHNCIASWFKSLVLWPPMEITPPLATPVPSPFRPSLCIITVLLPQPPVEILPPLAMSVGALFDECLLCPMIRLPEPLPLATWGNTSTLATENAPRVYFVVPGRSLLVFNDLVERRSLSEF